MAGRGVPLLCYWNGCIINGPRGIAYEGSIQKSIRVNIGITHNQLLEKMYMISGTDKLLFGLKLICRYPGVREYIALPIIDDDSVDIMLSTIEQPGANAVELYLERVPSCVDSGTNLLPTASSGSLSAKSPEIVAVQCSKSDMPDTRVCSPQCSTLQTYGFRIAQPGHQYNDIQSNETATSLSKGTNKNVVNVEMEEEIVSDEAGMVLEEASMPEFTNFDWVKEKVKWQQGSTKFGKTGELYLGQRFATKNDLQVAVKLYSIKHHRQCVVAESTPTKLVYKCKQASECKWSLRALVRSKVEFFEIRRFNSSHTCVSSIVNKDHRQLDTGFISKEIKSLVKTQPSITPADIQAEIAVRFKYNISYKKAWIAKQKAIADLFGNCGEGQSQDTVGGQVSTSIAVASSSFMSQAPTEQAPPPLLEFTHEYVASSSMSSAPAVTSPPPPPQTDTTTVFTSTCR